jgi:hypothetical protein
MRKSPNDYYTPGDLFEKVITIAGYSERSVFTGLVAAALYA